MEGGGFEEAVVVALLLVFSFLLPRSMDLFADVFADVFPPVVCTDEDLDGEADKEANEEVATRGGATERLNSR